jgi:hypothetical protein
MFLNLNQSKFNFLQIINHVSQIILLESSDPELIK